MLAIARFKALSSLRRRKDEQLDDEVAAAIPDTVRQSRDRRPEEGPRRDPARVHEPPVAGHREIIDLVYYHEKSVEEVAEIVGVPANTVKTRMFYARKRMSELLKQSGMYALAS